MQYTQQEFLQIINAYNNFNRENIKINLIAAFKRRKIKNKQIANDTGFSMSKVNSWFTLSSNNIPTFEDALMLAVMYEFNVEELIK